ncbi:MAG: PilZ domain-containing protein [Myxococcota bacterium]
MDAATERRDLSLARAPLDDVIVELAAERAEPFEADGLDICLGGLAMRAPVLPEVGDRLRCRFVSPETGATVDADGEVVWACERGPHLGSFGLRFGALADESEAAIAGIVDAWVEELGSLEARTNDGPPAPRPARERAPERVRLQLDGVAQALDADLVRELPGSPEAWVVEQALPFLCLDTGVETPDGRRGLLEDVDLRVEDGVPRLVLTLAFEGEEEPSYLHAAVTEMPTSTSTLPGTTVAPDDVIEDDTPDFEAPEAVTSTVDEALDAEALAPSRPPSVPPPLPVREQIVPVEGGPEVETLAPEETGALADEAFVQEDVARSADETPVATLVLRDAKALLALARRGLGRTGAVLVAAGRRVGPFVRRVLRTLRMMLESALRFGGARGQASLRSMRARRSAKRMAKSDARSRRRTTRPSDRRSAAPASPELPPPRGRGYGRGLLLVAAAGGLGAYFAGGGSDEAPVAALPAAPSLAAAAEPAPQVALDPPPAPTPAPEPEAVPVPGATPEGSPYAAQPGELDDPVETAPVEAVAGARSFGAADVPGGRSFRIPMSPTPTGLVGERRDEGFEVVVEGSLATQGARRIAGAHALVERAAILNKGDHAELSLRFVAGAAPAYRVDIVEGGIDVTVGR